MVSSPTRILIMGGGFGGLHTALRLSQFPWPVEQKTEITLIDQHDRFLFSPLLYELITEELQTWEIAPPFEELLAGTGVRFLPGMVTGIDVDAHQIQLADGTTLTGDRLVLALGGETPLDLVPGAQTHAITFRTVADAYQLQERLRHLEASDQEKIRVVVVGGGYSGVELACKLADRLGERGRVRIVERADQILRTSTEFNREAALDALAERGVWIDRETTVAEIGTDQIALVYKGETDTIPTDLVLWTVGNQIPDVVRSLPVEHNERGQLAVTATLQLVNHPDWFALGDLSDCKDLAGQQVPATAQAALQQADYVAWNLWANLTDRPLLPFRYVHLGEMMALGMDEATLTAMGLKLTGPMAAIARRLAYLYRMPTLNHQLKVGVNWITQPLVSLLSELGQTTARP